jgi:hypothetical protein
MKFKSSMSTAAIALCLAIGSVHGVASAAGSILMVNEPFPVEAPNAFAATAVAPASESFLEKPVVTIPYAVLPTDHTIREVLARWATATGWVHQPIHWTIDKDHPVEGSAGAEVFGTDFRAAVRLLLSSTDQTDRPVQPCFYSNYVVRVIAKAAMCDKAAR